MLIIRQDGSVALLLDLLSLPKRAVATDKDPYTHFTHVDVHCCHRGGELLEL